MATDWITSQITKKGRCVACLRDFEVGDDVLVPVNDDVAWINSTYCPKWVGHLDSANAYEEYLRDVKGITDFSIIKNMVFKWELHRVRKGYKSDVNIRELTKEQKKDIEKKIKAFLKYKSQVKKFPHPRSREGIINLSKVRGSQIHREYAEAFKVEKILS